MTTPASRSDSYDAFVATILAEAFAEYVALYGTAPHGTVKQLHSMLALRSAGKRIAALAAPRSERPFIPLKFGPGAKRIVEQFSRYGLTYEWLYEQFISYAANTGAWSDESGERSGS